MSVQVIESDDQYYLNYCHKHLARTVAAKSPTWQFPIVAPYAAQSHQFSLVSFIYKANNLNDNLSVGVIGTFANLYEPVPMKSVQFLGEPTGFYAVSVLVPVGEVHRYKFVVNGQIELDPINPQRVTLETKQTWSRFFTHHCFTPVSFESWQLQLLYRLLDHMMPFQSEASENFLKRYYDGLDQQAKLNTKEGYYRLDNGVGEVNFIDKLLAKEESHHLIDYQLCLKEIDRLLRQRNPFVEPHKLSRQFYVNLYNEMATGQVAGWNYQAYGNPLYFLQLLRRHAVLGAFSHPKYGGNAGGAGWAYLSDRYLDDNGNTLFDWRAAIEQPLGLNQDYNG